MKTPRRLLVPVTGDAHSLHALGEVLNLARVTGTKVTALAVAPTYDGDFGLTHVRDLIRGMRVPAEAALVRARELGQAAGLDVETLLGEGEPWKVIPKTAAEIQADLVVMGIVNRGTVARLIKGNVPLRTVGQSPVDVLLVPQDTHLSFGRLLFATDGSVYSQKAARRALELAEICGSQLLVLHVVSLPHPELAEAQLAAEEARGKGRELVDSVVRAARERGIAAEGSVSEGDPAGRILAFAAERRADCLILATHGKTGLERLLLGSVAEEVVGRAVIPVYVVV